jgi:hypothetical protein
MELLNQASRDRLRELIVPPETEEAHSDYLENILDIIANQFSKDEVMALVSYDKPEELEGIIDKAHRLKEEDTKEWHMARETLGRRTESALIEDILRSLEDLNKLLMDRCSIGPSSAPTKPENLNRQDLQPLRRVHVIAAEQHAS